MPNRLTDPVLRQKGVGIAETDAYILCLYPLPIAVWMCFQRHEVTLVSSNAGQDRGRIMLIFALPVSIGREVGTLSQVVSSIRMLAFV